MRTNGVAESREPICPLGDSPAMRAIWRVIEEIADTDATILIRGESGVGKDFVGRAIHARSARRAGPFIKVNCAAIPAELLESELFGHERGAFTGAYRRKLGLFECARGGTMYLDEIAELSLPLQAKLLHVLQDFCFCRLGGHGSVSINARVIATTNRDLERAMARREFREDLYHRVNVVDLRIPPLRERREEILPLAGAFLARFNARYGQQKELAPETLVRLSEYRWAGNVRELENVVRRMVVLAGGEQAFAALAADAQSSRAERPAPASSLVESLAQIARRGAREAERAALACVLEQVQWNRADASCILKVSYKTLLNKIAQCQLTRPARELQA